MEPWHTMALCHVLENDCVKSQELDLKNSKVREAEMLAADESGRKIWTRVKCLAGWEVSSAPSELIDNGGLITSPSKMANIFTQFIISKITKVGDMLNPIGNSPTRFLTLMFSKWRHKPTSSVDFKPLTKKDMEKLFAKLKT